MRVIIAHGAAAPLILPSKKKAMFLNIKTWWIRAAGHAIALLALIFLLVFFIGEGIPDIMRGNGKGLFLFLPFLL